jgi:hypothetical protein
MFEFVVHRCRNLKASEELARIDERLQKVENSKQPKSKSALDVFQAFAGIATPILIAIFAWWVTGRVELALKERQAQVGFVKEIQSLIQDLSRADDPDKAKEAGIALAAYGEIAVGPLMSLFRSSKQYVPQGAEEGLRTIGTTQPSLICIQMRRVIGNRTAIYSWENQKTAIELIGQLDCKEAVGDLQQFNAMLEREKLNGYKATVSSPAPNEQNVKDLRVLLSKVIAALRSPERN